MKMNKETLLLCVASLFLISSSLFYNVCLATIDNAEVEDESPFTYELGSEKGPEKWGNINPQWEVCQTGKFQSPIDLTSSRVSVLRQDDLWLRSYKPAIGVIKNRGHDIMLSWKEDVGKITINGSDYKLVQCHWHSPSEHTVNGTRFVMELHMVHTNPQGKIAVIGVLYRFGVPDPFLSRLLNGIRSVDKEEINMGIVDPRHIRYLSRKFYRYVGSLTVPPCTEGVIWTVVKRVNTVSPAQVRALREAVHDGFETNARPIQHQQGRPLRYYEPYPEQ
ncbi:PREDICTED: alpha carbonic anhydrase 4 [Tarenaya hassleriana]|uniref:alpha carbonic anhydrase 4 n=1 Tax=Tarenaya hassleriana TaxID=28532 RepID=UPI00053C39A6|nr:PREDICTED: alpha carbonic anhydrase 4 [Tarenaya hassleriana]